MMIYNFFSWFEHAFSGKTKKDFGAKSDFHCQSCSTFPNRIVTIIILVIFHKTSHWNYDFSDFIRKKGLNSARFIGRSSFFGKKNTVLQSIWYEPSIRNGPVGHSFHARVCALIWRPKISFHVPIWLISV